MCVFIVDPSVILPPNVEYVCYYNDDQCSGGDTNTGVTGDDGQVNSVCCGYYASNILDHFSVSDGDCIPCRL